MKRNITLPILPATATHLVLPEQLAQQAADAVRELLAEAAAANTGFCRDTCKSAPQISNNSLSTMA